ADNNLSGAAGGLDTLSTAFQGQLIDLVFEYDTANVDAGAGMGWLVRRIGDTANAIIDTTQNQDDWIADSAIVTAAAIAAMNADTTMQLKQLVIAADAGDTAVKITSGAGAGAGLYVEGGSTGNAVEVKGGSTSGDAVHITATIGNGMDIAGGGTSGSAVLITTTDGHGISISPAGTDNNGLRVIGSSDGTDGHAVYLGGGSPTALDIDADIIVDDTSAGGGSVAGLDTLSTAFQALLAEQVWYAIDTSNVDTSEIGDWLINNLSGASGGLDTLSTAFQAR
ncbi:unnamed protein product, partial [marine sediment metagenome]